MHGVEGIEEAVGTGVGVSVYVEVSLDAAICEAVGGAPRVEGTVVLTALDGPEVGVVAGGMLVGRYDGIVKELDVAAAPGRREFDSRRERTTRPRKRSRGEFLPRGFVGRVRGVGTT